MKTPRDDVLIAKKLVYEISIVPEVLMFEFSLVVVYIDVTVQVRVITKAG
ncbi:MAG: hypothetical protein H6625_00490 [Bdellovibrionaceae bacterium]|nr:hypothetical protein [Pseudobdellovibrionaceae bacterium]